MSISMFIKFPGVLITIGVILLIVAIIIGIISYKKEESNDKKLFGDMNDVYDDNVINDSEVIESNDVSNNTNIDDLELKQEEAYIPHNLNSIESDDEEIELL